MPCCRDRSSCLLPIVRPGSSQSGSTKRRADVKLNFHKQLSVTAEPSVAIGQTSAQQLLP